MRATIHYINFELSFDDTDVVDSGSFIPAGEYNPHNVHPWLLHDHGFALAVVFAGSLQDALDIAVDNDKLDHFLIDLTDDNQRADYMTDDFASADDGLDEYCPEYTSPDGKRYWWARGMTPDFLGNASEPFDIERLGYVELRNPPFSFAAMFAADFGTDKGAISANFA